MAPGGAANMPRATVHAYVVVAAAACAGSALRGVALLRLLLHAWGGAGGQLTQPRAPPCRAFLVSRTSRASKAGAPTLPGELHGTTLAAPPSPLAAPAGPGLRLRIRNSSCSGVQFSSSCSVMTPSVTYAWMLACCLSAWVERKSEWQRGQRQGRDMTCGSLRCRQQATGIPLCRHFPACAPAPGRTLAGSACG